MQAEGQWTRDGTSKFQTFTGFCVHRIVAYLTLEAPRSKKDGEEFDAREAGGKAMVRFRAGKNIDIDINTSERKHQCKRDSASTSGATLAGLRLPEIKLTRPYKGRVR